MYVLGALYSTDSQGREMSMVLEPELAHLNYLCHPLKSDMIYKDSLASEMCA